MIYNMQHNIMKIALDVILIQFATCILNGAWHDVMTEEMR